MSKVSTLARRAPELIAVFVLVAFAVLASGCGGSSADASVPPPSSNNPPPPPPPPAAVIEGVVTPTSVAVVTATNAQ